MKKETQTIEFKQSWHDEYLEWICGYANACGGTLYIGRADDGTPIGVAKAKSLMESIPCKITDTMGIIADVNLLNEEDEANREDNADNKTLVINAIARNSRLTVRQLATELPISKATVERVLKALQEAGKLRRIGGTRGVWKIIG